jgi:hypothetical protein
MHRGHARRPLAPWQRWMNRALAPIRAQVERSFGTLKRSYGWRRVRYRGLARNGAHLHLLCTAMNLRRAERLSPDSRAAPGDAPSAHRTARSTPLSEIATLPRCNHSQ